MDVPDELKILIEKREGEDRREPVDRREQDQGQKAREIEMADENLTTGGDPRSGNDRRVLKARRKGQ